MNPEFQRNLWLNISNGRLIMMLAVLGAIFFAASLVPGDGNVRETAQFLYVIIVVFWGTWLASRAVVGEIRDRTWDNQRMSSITPWAMVWGKLFGATIYVWYGGAICLAMIVWSRITDGQSNEIFRDIGFWITIGLFAHAVAMLASLLAVRRQARHVKLEVFAYQLAGLFAAWFAVSLWPGKLFEGSIGDITWFGMSLSADRFFLASLAAFILWAIVGNERLMRQELQFRNSPVVWIAFLIFMMAWVAGWVNGNASLDATAVWTLRVYAAGAVAAGLTYVMVILDTKDPVLLRWVANRIGSGHVLSALSRMPSWMWSLAAAGLMVVLIFLLPDFQELAGSIDSSSMADDRRAEIEEALRELRSETGFDPALIRMLILAGFFFLMRDVFIVLAFNAGSFGKRGDFAALVTLFVLYAVIPAIVMGLDARDAMIFFMPFPTEPTVLIILPPLVEAAIIGYLAWSRMSAVRQSAQAG